MTVVQKAGEWELASKPDQLQTGMYQWIQLMKMLLGLCKTPTGLPEEQAMI